MMRLRRALVLTLLAGTGFQPALSASPDDSGHSRPFVVAQASLEQQAEAALKASRWDEARKLAEQIITRQPQKASGYVLRGRALTNLGQFEQAAADYQKALGIDPKSAGALAGVAQIHLVRRELDQALTLLDQAIALDGKNPLFYFNRSLIRLQRNRQTDAVSDLDQALRLEPGNADYYSARALSHYSLKNFAASQQDITALLKLKPNQDILIRATNLQGQLHLEARKYPEALAAFQSSLKLRPKSPETLVNIGTLHLAQNQRELALKAFNDSLAIAPNELAYNRLGLMALEAKDYKQALEHFSRALEVSAQSSQYALMISRADLYNKRGQTYFQLNEPEKAIADHDAAIALEPDTARGYNYRAIVKAHLQNSDGALSDFNQALSKDPKYADAFRNRAQLWRQRGKYDAALADQGKLIALQPTAPGPLIERAQTFFALQRAEPALADLKAALALDPKFIPGYITRAELLLAVNAPEEAFKDATQVIKLDKTNVWGYIYRAEALISQKQYDGALKEYDAIAKLEPDNPAVNYHRGRIYFLKGDFALAEKDLKLALTQDAAFAPAWFFLGRAAAGQEKADEAREAYSKACELGLPVACEVLE